MADVVQQYHPHDLRLSAGAVASGARGQDYICSSSRPLVSLM
jgi:hypothetical protein